MERYCIDCAKPLMGRADKKFCDDGCRNNYNNRLKNKEGIVFKRINTILKKNRMLLSKFNPNGKIKISKKKMLTSGFNFDYFTHTYQTANGSKYYFCYEFGYLNVNEEELLLVKREEALWLS